MRFLLMALLIACKTSEPGKSAGDYDCGDNAGCIGLEQAIAIGTCCSITFPEDCYIIASHREEGEKAEELEREDCSPSGVTGGLRKCSQVSEELEDKYCSN